MPIHPHPAALCLGLTSALLVASPGAGAEEIYKSIGPDGEVTYSARPPQDAEQVETVDIAPGPTEADSALARQRAAAAAGLSPVPGLAPRRSAESAEKETDKEKETKQASSAKTGSAPRSGSEQTQQRTMRRESRPAGAGAGPGLGRSSGRGLSTRTER